MELSFYGGAKEVGRSCVVLKSSKHSFMFDCGIKLGKGVEYPEIPEGALDKVRNVFISHAHLDHCGYVPHLYNVGKKLGVVSTKPTRDLMGVLLADYLRIQKLKKDVKFTTKDVNEVLRNTSMYGYGKHEINGLKFEFFNAGHILGSAMIRVEVEGKKILYTGDVCTRNTRILEGVNAEGLEADIVISESTYSKDVLPSVKDEIKRLVTIINDTLNRGGHVLIPSFAVGRGQELLLLLDDLMRSGVLPQAPIYMDGMISKAMRIYRQNVIYASEKIKMRILTSDDDPFKSKFFRVPRSKERTDVLRQPSIIVSTSGMLIGGPSVLYLQKLAGDKNSTLVIAGYQAQNTPGRALLEGERHIKVGDKEIDVKMDVESVRLSGHADKNELTAFLKSIKGVETIFLMHGEDPGALMDRLGKYEVVVPSMGQTFRV